MSQQLPKGRYFDPFAEKRADLSAQPCGCDAGLGWQCDKHRPQALPTGIPQLGGFPGNQAGTLLQPTQPAQPIGAGEQAPSSGLPKTGAGQQQQLSLFPSTDAGRKALPVWTGVIMYFPRAIREVARVSQAGNDQHNPGQPLHWAKGKSTNQADTAMRHKMDHGVGNHYDTDGCLHQAKVCWRELAALETFLEQQERNQ